MAVPIWKDKAVSVGSASPTYFRIKCGGTVIYQGRLPDGGNVQINDICADWLAHARQTLSLSTLNGYTHPATFVVEKSTNGTSWSSVESVQFWDDWSYDASYSPSNSGMAFPINGHFDARQPLCLAVTTDSSRSATLYFKNGTSASVTVARSIAGFTDEDNSFIRSFKYGGGYPVSFYWDSYYSGSRTDIDRIVFTGNGMTFKARCGEYALYYKNLYGGWDFLLIEGSAIPGDSLTRWTNKVRYDNTKTANRGTFNYVNEVAKTYTLHPGLLDSEAVARMPHLLTSPDVYLLEIGTQVLRPVVLNTDQHEYKTVRQNGQNFVDIAISVSVAQHMERR
jgi:hypothetical protein